MKTILKTILPLIILVAGTLIGFWFFANPDEAQKRPQPEAQALLVETAQAEYGTYHAKVEAMGQIRPAVAASLRAQVAGEIIAVAPEFVPGGYFEKGEMLLQIDPADYRLAVQRAEAVLSQAEATYALEMGRQSIARDELAILERTIGRAPENPELALRGPQLAQAQAERESAEANLETAQLDLDRTILLAPFKALLTERLVNLGDKVSAGQELGTLVQTDAYWVEITIPVHSLKWLDIPRRSGETGSAATIILDGNRGQRQGYLARLTGALESETRMARLLITVPDPLGLEEIGEEAVPLILGDYVTAVLEGRTLVNVTRVPLSWVRDGNMIWVNEAGRLVFRPVEILYTDRDFAYLSEGITAEDIIVTSDIAVPVENMKIRTVAEARATLQEKMQGPIGPKGGSE